MLELKVGDRIYDIHHGNGTVAAVDEDDLSLRYFIKYDNEDPDLGPVFGKAIELGVRADDHLRYLWRMGCMLCRIGNAAEDGRTYKPGDRFIIEIDGVDGDLYRIKGFRTLVFDKYGLDKLERVKDPEQNDDDRDHINKAVGKTEAIRMCADMVKSKSDEILSVLEGMIGEEYDGKQQ